MDYEYDSDTTVCTEYLILEDDCLLFELWDDEVIKITNENVHGIIEKCYEMIDFYFYNDFYLNIFINLLNTCIKFINKKL